ncbi:SRPBCC family protein [Mucilaginibacter xinganensis]|uniref:Orotate phosphoribosyltransferase n=1 Tax=Mucilaginibacter xinganensis TaxID=1234841 RepID=A0A223NWB7_9SPHI|nr:SRPBCC family protein [Mucilaginibacter xinganensis]ASU33994.1 orotate phosphoribosyltransferase [Mucilaginibacter xinganensis]
MTTFESKVTIPQPVNKIFDFLADMNNHQKLMPGDDIQHWKSSYDEASFNIKNTINLSLKIEGRDQNREIKIVPAEKPPFDLQLIWTLLPVNDHTEVVFTISADLNMMMKMVVSGQLKKLAEHETNSLNLLFS